MMDYLSALMSLDGVAIAEVERSADFHQPMSAPERAALASLSGEAAVAASLVAISASLANALQCLGPAKVNARALTAFAPSDMSDAVRRLEQASSGEPDPTFAAPLAELRANLAVALPLSQTYVSEIGRPDGTESIDANVLAEAWQNVARAVIPLIEVLDGAGFIRHETASAPSASTLVPLLEAARSGAHPCVDAEGMVIVPGWAERRREARHRIDLEIDIQCNGRRGRARLVDVSRTGVGLEGIEGVKTGDKIEIGVPGRRPLTGRIVWAAGSKAGAELTEPLTRHDALLQAGRA